MLPGRSGVDPDRHGFVPSTPVPPGPGPRVTTPAGMEIATWDLGGSGPELLLIHGTGFHGRCWEPAAATLGKSFHVWAIDQRGHGASAHAPDHRYDDWGRFVDDLLAVVDGLALFHPYAGGHSLGAAVLILAEQRRPGTFAALYGYEPIILPPNLAVVLEGNFHLRDVSLKRRNVFDSLEAAHANFAAKLPFSRFDPAALDAYVAGGLLPRPDGTVGLACPGPEESSVYEGATRHHAYDHLGDLHLPVTLAGAADGGDVDPSLLGDLAGRIPGARVETLAGVSHFGPMEEPALVAEAMAGALLER